MKRFLFLAGLAAGLAFITGRTTAQQVDSTISLYSERFPQEKIHLHFDRPTYNKGETVWFKAYLLAGFDPSTLSRNIYFDWYDASGKLLKHEVAPIFEASSKGQFEIPADYAGNHVHVRAYTQWMLNFDTAFLYDKDIAVGHSAAAAGGPVRTALSFFPEGGDLVSGLVSKVAFKANDQWGIPVTVRGVVQGSDGSMVDSLTTEHDGMGTFFVRPVPGVTYTATWTDGTGKTFHTLLPGADADGATLQVQPHTDQSMVIVRRAGEAYKSLYLLVHMNQHVVYEAQLKLDDKTEAAVQIPTQTLPTGVLQFTLFDASWKPLAERVTFVNNQLHLFDASVNVLTRSQEKRGMNEIEINVPDSIFSNLSVAVTDGDLPTADDDIVSRFLLCDDIKGAVYHPSYYFQKDNPDAGRQLDLVMLTHGWRRFKWTDVVQGKMPQIRYPRDTNYLQLDGQVIADRLRDLAPDQQVMLVLETKDSSRRRLMLPVAPDGRFVQKGLTFYDTLKVYYDFPGNRKLSGSRAVELGNGLLSAPEGSFQGGGAFDTLGSYRTRFFAGQEAERERKKSTIDLAAITIRGKTKRPVDILDDKYASGMFKQESGYQFDVKDDPLAQHSVDIFFYLRQMVPGLEVTYKNATPILRWRQSSPVVFVDEVATRTDLVPDMVPVTDVAYVKVFYPPFMMGGVTNPRAGAIAIYTKKGEDVKPEPTKGLNYKLVTGYETERQFYSPDYSIDPGDQSAFLPDVRATLYWNPYVITDGSSHSARLTFYNNDISKKLRVVVEGMNAEGKLTRVEKVIE